MLNLLQIRSYNIKYHTFKVCLLGVQNNLQLLTSTKTTQQEKNFWQISAYVILMHYVK